ncbi:quinoprotein dehydrogenase-associated SoxYZ-like carrier [Azohydromonas caseinilytica]|uniref:Quinoprotein dehydrogenase-associated SoxYZ-like carrier n=1 Tax=Azohydromonas caseinilytica TaxID=2728836 RepID=A0A848F9B4_9BURK|nr:quinoprotein dehydrogenase-associated SoxYZ-like carrier [Azohydromonas caseinilytica]NML15848.1 quinoprotein dehydrogenase-associated SoxYZ-like carrier [Azohydromonas caseinilytica]
MTTVFTRRRQVLGLLLAAPAVTRAQLRTAEELENNPRWLQQREALFGARAIVEDEALISLQAPARAEDAAVVPIAVRAGLVQGQQGRFIRRLVLIIDNNPSPLAAQIEFGPASGRADLETRVRIDEYGFVRAIAEFSDGRLAMSKRFVKASGGCSAPPGKDAEAARATLGRMRLAVQEDAPAGQPLRAQLMVSHPNDSGLVMDQATRLYTKAQYVRRIELAYAGQPVLKAEVDFSLSENPHLRFWLKPEPRGGELVARVDDTEGRHFEQRLQLAA